MDFVFNCACCHGPLVARSDQQGLRIHCEHCASVTRIGAGRPVTESLVNAYLDQPKAEESGRVLRRVRPAVRHSSAPVSRTRPLLTRSARISRGL